MLKAQTLIVCSPLSLKPRSARPKPPLAYRRPQQLPTTVFTKISSTSTKTSSASSKAITYDIDEIYMSHSSDFLECSLQYSAQFDDRIIKPALTLLNLLGIEVNIFCNPWAVDNQPPRVGVPAHSQLNAIVTAFEQQATNGTPSLTILYPDSNLKSFDLHSFYFGYLANTGATAVDVALQCTIAVAGFREGQEVTVAGYTFTLPTAAVDVPMIQRCCRGIFRNRRMSLSYRMIPFPRRYAVYACPMLTRNLGWRLRAPEMGSPSGLFHLRATSVPPPFHFIWYRGSARRGNQQTPYITVIIK